MNRKNIGTVLMAVSLALASQGVWAEGDKGDAKGKTKKHCKCSENECECKGKKCKKGECKHGDENQKKEEKAD